LGAIGQLDEFAAVAGKHVFANVHPTIGDVINIGKDSLIDDDSIRFAIVIQRINRALGRRSYRRDAHINSIHAIVRAQRETPLSSTGGSCCTRPGIAHIAILGIAGSNVIPTVGGSFIKA
jgi:hypothetical protein